MIEAKGKVCLEHRQELTLLRVPARHLAARAHSKNKRLFRQRDWSGPGQAESAEIRDRGDGAAGGVGREPSLAR